MNGVLKKSLPYKKNDSIISSLDKITHKYKLPKKSNLIEIKKNLTYLL